MKILIVFTVFFFSLIIKFSLLLDTISGISTNSSLIEIIFTKLTMNKQDNAKKLILTKR